MNLEELVTILCDTGALSANYVARDLIDKCDVWRMFIPCYKSKKYKTAVPVDCSGKSTGPANRGRYENNNNNNNTIIHSSTTPLISV